MDDDEDAEKQGRRAERARKRQEAQEAASAERGEDPMVDLDPEEMAAKLKMEEEEEEAAIEEEEAKAMMEKELELCGSLAGKLADRLRARASNETSAAQFAGENKALAEQLCAAPGGLDLLRLTSQVCEFLLFHLLCVCARAPRRAALCSSPPSRRSGVVRGTDDGPRMPAPGEGTGVVRAGRPRAPARSEEERRSEQARGDVHEERAPSYPQT
jgi:hypothetical protein